MPRIFFFLFLTVLVTYSGISQGFINKNRAQVKKELLRQKALTNGLNIQVIDTDTTIAYLIRDANHQPADFIYYFDPAGKCNQEKVIASCDSCYQKFLKNTLEKKKYGWIHINGNQYASNFKSKRLLEEANDKSDHSYRILRTSWTKKLYKILLEGR